MGTFGTYFSQKQAAGQRFKCHVPGFKGSLLILLLGLEAWFGHSKLCAFDLRQTDMGGQPGNLKLYRQGLCGTGDRLGGQVSAGLIRHLAHHTSPPHPTTSTPSRVMAPPGESPRCVQTNSGVHHVPHRQILLGRYWIQRLCIKVEARFTLCQGWDHRGSTKTFLKLHFIVDVKRYFH